MTTPKWMTVAQVDFIHEGALKMAGGLQGTRDTGLLDSALARPKNLYAYGETDTFQLAASYAEGILRNHPFADGNKRSAFYTATDFLEQNGHVLKTATGTEHADMTLRLEQEEISREEAADYFRQNSLSIKESLGRAREEKQTEQSETGKETKKDLGL